VSCISLDSFFSFFFSSRRRHTRFSRDWSSDVCSSDLLMLDGHSITLQATIGITLFPDDGKDPGKLLQKAEQTMMLAKARSRNRFQFYIASVDTEMRMRRELAAGLREALANNQFHLVYQPQISLRDKRVTGVEALLRWHHPERGMVPPDLFIPLAEQSGAIIAIGEWVLDQACL